MSTQDKIEVNKFFRSKTFYWLILFIILYLFNCKGAEKEYTEIDYSKANLLAVVILDYKYEVEFFEHKPNTISVLVPKNIDFKLKEKVDSILKSDKTQSEVYKELAGNSVISHYVEIMKKKDTKNYVRRLVIKE